LQKISSDGHEASPRQVGVGHEGSPSPAAKQRSPASYGGIQVNFCKSPVCTNFGVTIAEKPKANSGTPNPYRLWGRAKLPGRQMQLRAAGLKGQEIARDAAWFGKRNRFFRRHHLLQKRRKRLNH